MVARPSPYAANRPLTLAQLQRMNQYPPVDPLTAAYLQQNQQATREGEERYLDTLGGRQGTRERVTGDLANYGQSFIDDANRNARLSLNGQLSDLASRGLSGSSIRSSVTNASNREKNAELARINDAIINRRVNADTSLSDQLYGLMERRTDVQPDPNMLAQLSQGLGQAGYGGGYGGGFGGGYGGSPYGGGFGTGIAQIAGGGSAYPRSAASYYANPQAYNATLRPTNAPINAAARGGSPYRQPGVTPGGYDNPLGSAINRYNNRQAENINPYGAGQFGGFGFGGFDPYREQFNYQKSLDKQQAQRNAADRLAQMAQAANQPKPQWRDVANQYAVQPWRLPPGADPIYSRPGYEVYNAENTVRLGGDPSRFAGTRVVSGAPPAGTRIIPGQAQLGSPQFMTTLPGSDRGGYGGYGYGYQQPAQQVPVAVPNQPVPYGAPSIWNTFGGGAPMRPQQQQAATSPYGAPSLWNTFGGQAPMRPQQPIPYAGTGMYRNYM